MHIQPTVYGVLVTAIAVCLSGCGKDRPAAAPPAPPEVTVAVVHPTNVPISVTLPGRTSAFLVAQVCARVDGVVQDRTFVEGDDVQAGQLLYRIDAAPYRAALANAQAAEQKAAASLVASKASADRYRSLLGGTAVSKQAVDNAVAAKGQAVVRKPPGPRRQAVGRPRTRSFRSLHRWRRSAGIIQGDCAADGSAIAVARHNRQGSDDRRRDVRRV